MNQPAPSARAELIRYDIRRDRAGWTVYDVRSGEIAVINDVLQVGLDMDEADAIADALSADMPLAALSGHLDRFPWFQLPLPRR
ncbi:hypothetical protein VQ02_13610 [Methylobacterium variabile]|uniref:Uncharacterized protein n=2 Tax=Methylobacterium variabile TaxID=298794 RepID=A0A0J6SUV9_9HYPH|nr:hypothetical protein VQ02_13610 [Methylobacterium variabile]